MSTVALFTVVYIIYGIGIGIFEVELVCVIGVELV